MAGDHVTGRLKEEPLLILTEFLAQERVGQRGEGVERGVEGRGGGALYKQEDLSQRLASSIQQLRKANII